MTSRYAALFAELDALDLYETWKITALPPNSANSKVLMQIYRNRKATVVRLSCHTLADGWLFVRLE